MQTTGVACPMFILSKKNTNFTAYFMLFMDRVIFLLNDVLKKLVHSFSESSDRKLINNNFHNQLIA